MPHDPTQSPDAEPSRLELQSLLDALCQQTLTATEAAHLAERLRTDLQSRKQYVQYLHMHACLRTHLGTAVDSSDQIAALASDDLTLLDDWAADSAPLLRDRKTSIAPPVPSVTTWLDAAPLVLSALLLVALGILVGMRTSGTRTVPPAAVELTGPNVAISPLATLATLSGSLQADQQTLATGAALAAGQRLQLDTGTAEFVFFDGSTICLSAPSTLVLEAPSRAFLEQGKLLAQVGSQNASIVIDTPSAQIRDLGTSFGLFVLPDGTSEVHVLSGSVQVSRTAVRGQRDERPLELSAGTARRLSARDTQWQSIPFRPDQFERPAATAAIANATEPPHQDQTIPTHDWAESFDPPTLAANRWVTGNGVAAALPQLGRGEAQFTSDSILLTAQTYPPSSDEVVELRGRLRLLHPSALIGIGTRLQWKTQAADGETSGVACLLALRSTEDPSDPRPYVGILDSLDQNAHAELQFAMAVGDEIEFVTTDNGQEVTFDLTNLTHPEQTVALRLPAALPGRDNRVGVFARELMTTTGAPLFALEQMDLTLKRHENPPAERD